MTAIMERTETGPTLGKIVRHAGIAGQLAYSVAVTYPGERAHVVTFTGSAYGMPGPVVMITPHMPRGMFVDTPDRFGDTLSPEWVRRFFSSPSV